MHLVMMPINEIKPYERNPRNNTHAVAKVAASLKTYGWQQPIVVDTDHIIIVGHTRWLAAQSLKMTEVPVQIAQTLTPEQVRAYRIADNRLGEEAEWNEELLREELSLLREMEVDLSLTGFEEGEVTKLLGLLTDETEEASSDGLWSDAPVVSRRGDVWELDTHRLMCGDATSPEDLERLMAGTRADLVFTDPPYNVDYTGVAGAELARRLQNDHLEKDDYHRFLQAAFSQAARWMKPEASLYVCHASQSQDLVQQALEASGFLIRAQIVWAKNHFVLNRGRYKTQHELIFYAHRRGHVDSWYGDRSQSTLWSIDRPLRCDLHPTMKPLALVQRALENSALPGDRVLDMFGGAGSTLIACEHTHRQAYVMEIDPRYVDTIVRRWQQHTARPAVLSGAGQTFDACLATARRDQDGGD